MKRTKNRWSDYYTRKAQKENYAARSVYKLAEIQKKYRIICKADRVLDLGCSPGSWLQYAAQLTGPGGRVTGIDLKPVKIQLPEHVTVIAGDIYDLQPKMAEIAGENVAVVLSDMAPATTGSKITDTARSFELCRTALSVAEQILVPGGRFVTKIFQGDDFKAFCDQVKKSYQRMVIFKPQSSRKGSREIFVIGLEKKPN
ncbi:MAG: RlmE family RNA methyltransferase [Desulfobacteraceae bacterium]|nr:RlmE family RNA methyltransferase [Desulfobacteraceae bacterium]